jgi:SET family sugar efflux transporter-like MFS transporter
VNGWIYRLQVVLRQPRFAGLLAASVALGLGFSFVSPFLSIWGLKYVGMKPMVFGLFMTAAALSSIFVSTSLARWSDTHLPRKAMLLFGAVGGLIGYPLYAYVRDPRLLVLIAVTLVAPAALCFSQLFAHTRDRFAEAEMPGVDKSLPVSMVRVCFSLAWTAGPSLGAWMLLATGFHGLFLGAGALFLVFIVGIVLYVPYEQRPLDARQAIKEPVWQVLSRGDVFAAFFAFFLCYTATSMDTLNLPLLITQDLHGTKVDLGIAYGIGPIVEMPLMLWFGYLAGRGRQLALIRLGAILTLAYFLALSLAHAPWHVFLARAISGACIAIISNVAILFFQDLVPGQAGLATTVFYNATYCGNLLGYLTFGATVERVGHRGIEMMASGLAAGMGLILFFIYRPRGHTGRMDPTVAPPMSVAESGI